MSADSFDYVIVGGGAAGSILASRLTEDPGVTVCVLEAGPEDTNPFIHIPAGFIKTLFNPKVSWQFKTEPTEWTGGRGIATTQGRTLGGSSSINGMVYNRGQKADFDSWAQRGNRGWGYADILPYFRRSERRVGPADDTYHGRDGKIPVTDMDWFHPLCEAFMAGAAEVGLPRNPDYNGASQEGVGYFQRAIEGGWRRSAARMFLHPARSRAGLEVRTNARASAIMLDGKRAVGVRYIVDRGSRDVREVRARKEVIISAGTVNTARLLQISGIGPAAVLGALGVPVLHELAGVGQNFRDHYSVRIVARAKNVVTLNELSKGPRLLGQIARWALGKPSILAVVPSLVHIFARSSPHLQNPDLQGVFTPGSYAPGKTYVLDDYPGMTTGFWPHRPESTGHVRAVSTDPFVDPILQPNYLSHPTDRQVLVAGVRLARQMLATSPMSQYFHSEQLPGVNVQSDAEILDFARQYGTTTYHLIGTARMGPASDPTAVVDDELRVHGMQGLRVVDASVMPSMPSANTYASTMMIAEKASDMIRGKAPLPSAVGVDG